MVCTEKVVVDQVSGWLTLYDDGSVDRSWTGPKEFEFLATPVPPSDPSYGDGVATKDVLVDPSISNLSVRIYRPEPRPDDPEKLPILLHFHGGGFCVSRATWYLYHQFYIRLVSAARALCVSVDLRLAPEHRLPAAVHDGLTALSWLRALALGEREEPWLSASGDFARVFLIGDSSGGNLVHAVAAAAGETPEEEWAPLRLAGGVPIHPGFVRQRQSESEGRMENETPFLTKKMAEKFLALALPPGSTRDHPITCPMGELAPPLSGVRLPPMLVLVAERDLFRDTNMEYVEAMKKAGKEVEVGLNEGVTHSFYLNKVALDMDPTLAAKAQSLIEMISDFIGRH